MYRIEGIEPILDSLALPALTSVIEPDWNQCQYRESLGCKFNGIAEEVHWNEHPFIGFAVNINHGRQLENPCAAEIPEHMKQNYGHHAPEAVVYETNGGEQQAASQSQSRFDAGFCRSMRLDVLPDGIDGTDGQQPQQQGKHHVLVEREDESACIHQVERNFRNQPEQKEPHGILAEIGSMSVTFRNLKGENWKGQAADIIHPHISGYDGGPQVVRDHEEAGQPPEHVRRQHNEFLLI